MKRFTAFISSFLILTMVLVIPGSSVAASNRTTVVGGIWAKDAPVPGNNPIAGNTYANDALSEALINDGWPFSQIVDSANFNEFMRRVSTILTLAEQWGILPWSSSTSYSTGALVIGSNNFRYRALQDSAGEDPVSYPTYWGYDTNAPNFAVSTGSSNAYAITIPQKDALTPGVPVFFKANFTNTGSVTLSVNSQTPVVINSARGAALSAGDILQDAIVVVTYDNIAANYVLISGNVAYLSDLANYAAKNGNSAYKFSVANGTTGYDAVNYAQMMAAIAGVTGVDLSAYAKTADVSAALLLKASKNGDANNKFSVANGVSGNDAVNYQQMMAAIAGATGVDLSAYAKTADVSAALLLKADLNGNSSNTFSVANGTSGNQAVNISQFTGSNQNKSTNGYQKFPGGFMIMWGYVASSMNEGSQTLTYNTGASFTTAFSLSVTVQCPASTSCDKVMQVVGTPGPSSASLYCQNMNSGETTSATGYYWMAMGRYD